MAGDEEDTIICPNCGVRLRRKDISVIMFSEAAVVACPRCKKTISLSTKNF